MWGFALSYYEIFLKVCLFFFCLFGRNMPSYLVHLFAVIVGGLHFHYNFQEIIL